MGDVVNLTNRESWTDQAACLQYDPDTFYPDSEDGTRARDKASREPAIAVCRTCEVRDPCLRYALTNNERWGIWGGLTPEERATIRRRPT